MVFSVYLLCRSISVISAEHDYSLLLHCLAIDRAYYFSFKWSNNLSLIAALVNVLIVMTLLMIICSSALPHIYIFITPADLKHSCIYRNITLLFYWHSRGTKGNMCCVSVVVCIRAVTAVHSAK